MSIRTTAGMWLVFLLAGCGVSKDEFAAVQRDSANNLKKYEDEAKKSAALEKKVADLQAKNDELTQSSAQLTEEKGALAAKSKEYEELAQSLKKEIASGEIELSELRGKMTVKLRDRILFASGSAAINSEGRKVLDAVAGAFKGVAGKNVIVAGFTDDVRVGKKLPFKDNWDLSTARAVSVVRYLQGREVDPRMLGAAGFSEYRPRVPNDSAENRSQNRRIEIALSSRDYVPPVVEMPTTQQPSAEPAR